MWAVAEVSWEDQTGKPNHESATLEDTSASGACVRLKSPVHVGSFVTIKWHREQFSAVARNCRADGKEFLLGVRRAPDTNSSLGTQEPKEPATVPTTGPCGESQRNRRFASNRIDRGLGPACTTDDLANHASRRSTQASNSQCHAGSQIRNGAFSTRASFRSVLPRRFQEIALTAQPVSVGGPYTSSRKECHATQETFLQVLAHAARRSRARQSHAHGGTSE